MAYFIRERALESKKFLIEKVGEKFIIVSKEKPEIVFEYNPGKSFLMKGVQKPTDESKSIAVKALEFARKNIYEK